MSYSGSDFSDLQNIYYSINNEVLEESCKDDHKKDKKGKKTAKVKVVRKSETDEWLAKVWLDGKYSEENTYYTDDKEDANNTAKTMKEQYKKQGYTIVESTDDEEDDESDDQIAEYEIESKKVVEESTAPKIHKNDDFSGIYDIYTSSVGNKSEELVEENILDRTKARMSGLGRAASDSFDNLGKGLRNVGRTFSGAHRGEFEKGRDVKDRYQNKKVQSITNSYIRKLEKVLSNFATDLVKLDIMSEDDAENMAQTAMDSIKSNKTLRNIQHLHDY